MPRPLSERTLEAHPAARPWLAARARYAFAAALAVTMALGLYLRFFVVIPADFPLNDGGLFYLMTQELQRAHYVLPAFTSYNSAHIPFAYPPLAFYLAGFISDITGWALLDVVRVLPAVISTLTIPAFYLLSRAMLRSRLEVLAATFAFAMLQRTFGWFIMGGGLTRAPGLLFAILMLHQAYLLYRRGEMRYVFSTAVFGSLAVLSHPENTWFAVYSAALFLIFFGRNRRAVVNSLFVLAGVLVLTSPWWVAVVSRHGIAPILAAGAGGGYDNFHWKLVLGLDYTDEPRLKLFGALGLIGLFVALAQRRWALPVWFVAVFVINPRNPATSAMIPLALLFGIAIGSLVVPGIRAAARAAGDFSGAPLGEAGAVDTVARPRRGTSYFRTDNFTTVVLGLMLALFAGYSFLSSRSAINTTGPLSPLPVAERQAMAWVRANTAASSRFVVMPTADWFGTDATAEWFPVLAARPSVATPQGAEWLAGRQFKRLIARYEALTSCTAGAEPCLARWAAANQADFTHVYLPRTRDGACCAKLRESLRASPGYATVFDGPGGTIFARATRPR